MKEKIRYDVHLFTNECMWFSVKHTGTLINNAKTQRETTELCLILAFRKNHSKQEAIHESNEE